jgi:NAD(P)-dependent dehydrogenase (short-subunit alcohol dehydrogenase family)
LGRLEGKRALITGASTGIGRAIAVRFASEGASVAVGGHANLDAADKTLHLVDSVGGRGLIVQGDVAEESDAARLVEEAVAGLDGMDTLVLNAGIDDLAGPTDVADYDIKMWDRIVGVNLRGAFLVARFGLRQLLENGGGAVLGIGSVGGLVAWPGASAYCAAKAGLHALVQTIAVENAEKGIRANCICPGVIEGTAMHEGYMAAASDPDALEEAARQLHPVRRLGRPEEIAALAVTLCSDETAFVTGALIPADGGFTAV